MALDPDANGSAPPVALVLPGGGARGAYEVGALSVLLPALHERGERVSILCGTSVGAINAALLASLADRPVATQVQVMLDRWRAMRKSQVMAPVVGPSMLITLARMVGEALDVPGLHLGGLLDARPMRSSVERWVDWLALHRNVKAGDVDAVCVIATALSSGSPVAFVESRRPAPPSRPGDDVRYVRVALEGEHVLASAAIPVLFSPVAVHQPKAARDHYIDGGTRLNSPIKPALALGAERIVVIGFEPFSGRARLPVTPREPRLADVAANILDGLLVDQVGADLRRLAAVNSFFVDGPGPGPSRAARAYRTARGHKPYRRISYALVAPVHEGQLGRIAEGVFQRRFGGVRGLLAPDYPVMSRFLGGRTRSRGELLSFLLFDPVFTEELIEAGRADAQRWLDRHPRFWCSDASHDLADGELDEGRVREQQALDEFRERHRR